MEYKIGEEKTAVLFLNLGGPDTQEAVGPFLYNLFSDPDIIKLPWSWLMQKPIAWSIVTWRKEEVKKAYQSIGGGSPILSLTRAQADALEQQLKKETGSDIPVYIAMRYWHPFTEETVNQILADGIKHLVVLPLFPQYSHTSTGSSINELRRVLNQKTRQMKIKGLTLSVIETFYDDMGYQAAVAQTIQEGLQENKWSCPAQEVQILFSAHSLPLRHVKRTKDPYPEQIRETIQLLMRRHFPQNQWELCYQSKVGPMPWLGPDNEGVLHYFAGKNMDNVLMVPISFVSDHIETLYEIDQLYVPLAKELGLKYCARTKSLNNNPLFIQAMANLVRQKLPSVPSAAEATV